MCVLYTAFLQQFFAYFVGGDASYLDLLNPGDPDLPDVDPGIIDRRCGRPDNCEAGRGALQCFNAKASQGFSAVKVGEALPLKCNAPAEKCVRASVPLAALQTELLGLYTVDRKFNPFNAWAILYFLIMFLMVGSITVHDLMLLHPCWRPGINTRMDFNMYFPRLSGLIRALLLRDRMHSLHGKACWLWVILLPIWSVWGLSIFTVFLYPIVLCCYLWWPRSLARVMVFYTALLCFCWSLLFVLYMSLMTSSDLFTVFWTLRGDDADCVCYCQYPLRGAVVLKVVLLAAVACVASFGIGFRALKGLRQSCWATLFSVTYTVPIEVFPTRWESREKLENVEVVVPHGVSSPGFKLAVADVETSKGHCVVEHLEEGSWAERVGILQGDQLIKLDECSIETAGLSKLHVHGPRPLRLCFVRRSGGGPIRFRRPGEEVQGEPAFDPFCLMDEQPESALTSVRLVPCGMTDQQRRRWQPDVQDTEELRAGIGGCGFPFWQEKVPCRPTLKLDGGTEATARVVGHGPAGIQHVQAKEKVPCRPTLKLDGVKEARSAKVGGSTAQGRGFWTAASRKILPEEAVEVSAS